MSGGTEWKEKKLYYSKEPGCDYNIQPQDLLISVRKCFIKIGRRYFLETRAPRSSRRRRRYIYFNNVRRSPKTRASSGRHTAHRPRLFRAPRQGVEKNDGPNNFGGAPKMIKIDDGTKPSACVVRTVISREKNATARSMPIMWKKHDDDSDGKKNNKNAPRRGTPRAARLEGGWAGGWRHGTPPLTQVGMKTRTHTHTHRRPHIHVRATTT